MGDGLAQVGVAGGRGIVEMRAEARARGAHDVARLGAREGAVHALTLLQAGVGDHRAAGRRIGAAGREGAEVDGDGGMRRHGRALQRDRRQRQGAGDLAERVVDEKTAHVVLLRQQIDDPGRQRLVAARDVDEVGAAVGRDDDLRLVGVAADQPVAAHRIGARRDDGVLGIGIVEIGAERMGEVEREEARRQLVGRHVLVGLGRRPARGALLGDGGEAVVGGDDHVGRGVEALFLQAGQQVREIVVGVPDRGERGRAVDARHQAAQAVALVMLRAVGIARPVDHHEGLVARLEHRQHGLGGDVGEVLLLIDVGGCRAGHRVGAGLAVVAAGRRLQRQLGRLEALLQLVGQGNAAGPAGLVVDRHGLLAGALGVVEDQRRAELADGRGREAGAACGLQDRVLVEIVAGEVVVDVAQHRIVLEEGRAAAVGAGHREAGVDHVAEVAGVADMVAGRHARGVGRGEGREQRVRVGEAHAARHEGRHRGRGLVVHHAGAQAVGHEQHDIVRLLLLGKSGNGQGRERGGNEQQTHRIDPPV